MTLTRYTPFDELETLQVEHDELAGVQIRALDGTLEHRRARLPWPCGERGPNAGYWWRLALLKALEHWLMSSPG